MSDTAGRKAIPEAGSPVTSCSGGISTRRRVINASSSASKL